MGEGYRSIGDGRSRNGFFVRLMLLLLSIFSRNDSNASEDKECGQSQVLMGRSDESSGSINSDVVSHATRTTQSHSESAITNRSIEDHQLNITDLPLLPLLLICGFLRKRGYDDCKDLKHFKNTCRSFAKVVNKHLENAINWPSIALITLVIKDNYVNLLVTMKSDWFFLHPISKYRDFKISFNPKVDDLPTFSTSFDMGIEGIIDELAQILIYRLGNLTLRIYSGSITTVRNLCRNLKYSSIKIDVVNITEGIGRLINYLANDQATKLKIELLSYGRALTNPSAFLDEVDTVANSLKIINHVSTRTPLGLSRSFWHRKLTQKIAQNLSRAYVGHENLGTLERGARSFGGSSFFHPNDQLNRIDFNSLFWYNN